jgi:hypothetical protein
MTRPPRRRLVRGEPAALPPLRLAADGGVPRRATRVVLLDDGERLHVRFECADPDPWATLLTRNGPLWEEEVVEVFLAAGPAWPRRYLELEVNPLGTVFAAWIGNPRGDRRALSVEPISHCADLETRVALDPAANGWRAELALPWAMLAARDTGSFRANFYRVERPRPGTPEHSAWSPTFVEPPDFHRPARFGSLQRDGW